MRPVPSNWSDDEKVLLQQLKFAIEHLVDDFNGMQIRTDGQTEDLHNRLDEYRDEIKAEVRELRNDLVSKLEFNPVKTLVFGGIGAILLALVGALMAGLLR